MDQPDGGRRDAAAHGTSRRWFLAGGVAVLLGAGAGVAAEFLTHDSPAPDQPHPPQVLLDAVAAEQALLADLDATTGGAAQVRAVIGQVRADHAAHLAALRGLVDSYGVPDRATASPSPSPARGTPRTRAALQAAEVRASAVAARRAAALSGGRAALFASIAASEATHAELLA